MIRKLLNISTKKLKTINHKKSSLSQWALRQLNFRDSTLLFPSQLEKNKKVTRNRQMIDALAFSCQPFPSSEGQEGKNWGQKGRPNPWPAQENVQRKFLKSVGENGQEPWVKHSLRLISRERTPENSNYPLPWKSLYSLDQLMSHQFDSQWRLRCSAHKKRLMELQKLSFLYGKLSKKQRIKLFSRTHHIHAMAELLERRLDTAVRRCFAFATLSAAHHWISQGKIFVNGRPVSSAHYQLQAGDCLSLAPHSQKKYKQQFLQLFYSRPRHRKFSCSGQLLERWKKWASLYGRLPHHFPLAKLNFHSLPEGAGVHGTGEHTFQESSRWPDKAIQRYWYGTGRCNWPALGAPLETGGQSCGRRAMEWLRTHPWPQIDERQKRKGRRYYRFYSHNRRAIYRRRAFTFSQWLLSKKILLNDGLYNCRWLKAFTLKKSYGQRANSKFFSLQKPLHFEISYRKQCAIFLYPPQRLLWTQMIDLNAVHS